LKPSKPRLLICNSVWTRVVQSQPLHFTSKSSQSLGGGKPQPEASTQGGEGEEGEASKPRTPAYRRRRRTTDVCSTRPGGSRRDTRKTSFCKRTSRTRRGITKKGVSKKTTARRVKVVGELLGTQFDELLEQYDLAKDNLTFCACRVFSFVPLPSRYTRMHTLYTLSHTHTHPLVDPHNYMMWNPTSNSPGHAPYPRI
jgi:hypothetical protein